MYEQRNIEARSYNNFFPRKYNEYYIFWVCVLALVIQYAKRMRHFAIFRLINYTIFFHIVW